MKRSEWAKLTRDEKRAELARMGATTNGGTPAARPDEGPGLLLLAASDDAALRELAEATRRQIAEQPERSLRRLCSRRPGEGAWRLAAVATSAEALDEQLAGFLSDRDVEGLSSGSVAEQRPKTVFLFTGQGAQYAGMGKQLYVAEPVFREALDRCAEALRDELEQPLLEVMFPADGAKPLLDQTAYTQPALFAIEYALVALLRSWKVEPDVLIGHSIGEYVAACVSGVMELDEALHVVARRAQLMQTQPGDGAMAAVMSDVETVSGHLDGGPVVVAAINAPAQTVISGERDAVLEAVRSLGEADIVAHPLRVSHAFHSPLMASAREPLAEAFGGVRLAAPRIPIVSNVTGELLTGEQACSPDYWVQHMCEPVRFLDGMRTTAALDAELFVEIGPAAPLSALGRMGLGAGEHRWLTSLEREPDDRLAMLALVGELFVAGVAGAPGRRKSAPEPGQLPMLEPDPAGAHDPFPLTGAQAAYFVGKRIGIGGDRSGCHTYLEFELDGLDTGRLEQAWRDVVTHHRALHTEITRDGRQRVLDPVPELTIDVNDVASEALETHLAATRERLSHRIYAPGEWPLFEVRVTRVAGRAAIVHVSMDSSIVDGRSAEIVYDHWRRRYLDPDAELPAEDVSLRDYVLALRRFESTDRYREGRDFWLEKLRGAQLSDPPLKLDGGGAGPVRRRRLEARIEPAAWAVLTRLASEQRASTTVLVLTAFTETLAGALGRDRLAIAMTHATPLPLHPEVERLVGPLTTVTVFLGEPSASDSFADAVRETQRQLWADVDHSVVSAGDALAAIGQEQERQVMLPIVFTSRVAGPRSDGWLDHLTYGVSQTPGVALECHVAERDGGLVMSWDVVDAAFETGSADAAFAACVDRLHALAGDDAAKSPPELTALQLSYLAARVAGGGARSTVYQSFDAGEITPERFEQACARLRELHPLLGSVVGRTGTLSDAPEPEGLPYTVTDVSTLDEADQHEHLTAVASELAEREFAVGEWPHCDLRLTLLGDGRTRVHICVDMLVADGREIVLLWHRLLALCAGEEPVAQASAPRAGAGAQAASTPRGSGADGAGQAASSRGSAADGGAALARWSAMLADLPAGPRLPAAADPQPARRRSGVVKGSYNRVVAAFAAALARAADADRFPFTVADVTPAGTSLGWIAGPAQDADRQVREQLELGRELPAIEALRALRAGDPGWSFDPPRVVLTLCRDTAKLTPPRDVALAGGLSSTPGVDLDCFVFEQGDELHVHWDTSGAIDDDVMERAFADFSREFGASHRDRVVGEWNATAAEFDREVCLHELFERQAAEHPERVAVVDAETSLSYGELDRDASRLAARLQAAGMRRDDLVGIRMARSPRSVVAIMAILKAGGGYVPLALDEPAARRERILRTSRLTLVVADAGGAAGLGGGIDVVDIDEALRDGDAEPRPADVRSTDRAYAIFTSGSTGEPKGVAVSHRSVVNLIEWLTATFEVGPEDRALCVSPLTFDLSVYDVFGLLAVGGSIRMAGDDERRDPRLLARILRDEAITIWNSAPAALQYVMPMLGDEPLPGQTPRLVLLSGDWIPLELPAAARSAFADVDVISLGGATEATVWSNFFRVGDVSPQWRSIPYGRPIQNATYFILDPDGELCPPDVSGELFIGGECVAQGYLNDPERTAERFVPDPFAPGGRLYRTGDLARWWQDGTIELLGRIDNQVKVRGHRIELGEVEDALRRAGVRDAVAVMRGERAEDLQIVAFGAGTDIDEQRTLDALRDALPEYMLPSRIVALPEFPLTSNGKVDRAALRDLPLEAPTAPAPAAPAPDGPEAAATEALAPAPHGREAAAPASEPPAPEAAPPAAPASAPAELAIEPYIRERIAELLEDGVPAADLDADAPFGQLGLTSLHFALLTGSLLDDTGIELSPTIFYRHTTIAAICAHLRDEHAAGFAAEQEERPAAAQPLPDDATQLIAVVGMKARMPRAESLDEFWQHLVDGVDGVEEIPRERWDWRAYHGDPATEPGKTLANRAGFVPRLDHFDAAFFGISPREAELMDPRQRLLLEVVWSAIEHSGHRVSELSGQPVGVFVGATGDDFARLSLTDAGAADAYTLTGISPSLIANRLSYYMNLRGPSEVVDTACSSSLVAVHRAVRALRDGECEVAIAAAANTILEPATQVALSRVGMLSPDGRCKTFDAAANGYARGEGIGAVVLKPLAAALADGDSVYGVIAGSAVNHGGRANSLTAPNPQAQTEVLLAAHRDAGGDPSTVGYLETHGTGTELGDPIEINALTDAFATLAAERGIELDGTIQLGAVKSHVGHLESAAGMAGLLAALLVLRAREVPATLHLHEVNPHIELEGTPFALTRERTAWAAPAGPRPRRAGVSAFGFGGTNAHVVLDEYPTAHPQAAAQGPQLIVLSARDEAALRRYASAVATFLERPGEPPAAADIAHTLRVGRDAMRYRLAFVAGDLGEIRERLAAFGRGEDADVSYGDGSGDVPAAGTAGDPAALAERSAAGETVDWAALTPIAERWAAGGTVDWSTLKPPDARRIELPTYPFAANRIPFAFAEALEAAAATITGDEFFVAEHVVAGDPVMAGAAYLELVRARAEQASLPSSRIEGFTWLRPVLGSDTPLALHTEFEDTAFTVTSGDGTVHATGKLSEASEALAKLEFDGGGAQTIKRDECYARLSALGVDYGPGLRVIDRLRIGDGEALALLSAPTEVADDQLALHPAIVDGALQVALLLDRAAHPDEPLGVPYTIDELTIDGPLPQRCQVVVRAHEGARSDIDIADLDGTVLVRLRGLAARPVAKPAAPVALADQWIDAEPAAQPVAGEIAVAGSAELATALDATAVDLDDVPAGVRNLVVVPQIDAVDELQAQFALARRLAGQRFREPFRLLYVVTGGPLQSALGALGRSLAAETPRVSASSLQIDEPRDWSQAAGLVRSALAAQAGDLRATGGALQQRAFGVLEPPAGEPRLRRGGVYVITGGLGRLGTFVAEHLAERVGARIVLIGRSPAGEAATRALGADAIYLQADTGDDAAVRAALEQARSRFGAINGVFHCAGVSDEALLFRKDWHEIEPVLAAKVRGAEALDRATAGDDLDCFVLFSSLAGVTGGIGIAAYAYANAFLDHYARERARRGATGRSLSIGWAPWRDGGLQLSDAALADLRRDAGIEPLDRRAGLRALDTALAGTAAHVVVAPGEPGRVRDHLQSPPEPEPEPEPEPAKAPRAAGSVADLVRAIVAEETKNPIENVRADEPFETYGIDSLLVMAITRRLEDTFGELPKTLLFENQSIVELAEHLERAYPEAAAGLAPEQPTDQSPSREERTVNRATNVNEQRDEPAESSDDIAIIGMAGRFPGSDTLEEFWASLVAGTDEITEIPPERWDHNDFPDVMKWGGFMNGVDRFDPLYFSISNREAAWLDPQERLFLQTVVHTLEDAGYTRGDLAAEQVGVYVGLMWAQYQLYGAERANAASSYGSIANRVSYHCGFSGPSIALDTMCSSSLTSIHLACQSLREGETDVAIAGGVNVNVHPNKHMFLSTRGFAAEDGRCRSFGEGGTGYVPGEGIAALLLKPLAAARRDSDRVYAVIKASAINHDGKTNGFTVPNPKAQQRVIARAMQRAGVDPRTISYLEAHGTGTSLGDPIELAGLSGAYGDTPDTGYCAIGSVKSNIGHLEGAAGVAGVIKTVLQMRHRTLVPSLHAETLNPNLDFDKTPFVVQRELGPWAEPEQQGIPRRAGVSSFGAGGANAHVILEDAPEPAVQRTAADAYLVTLSAKDDERLREYAERVAAWLRDEPATGVAAAPPATDVTAVVREAVAAALDSPVQFVDIDDEFEDFDPSQAQLKQLAASLQERVGIELEPKDLEVLDTLADLAALLDASNGSTPAAAPDAETARLGDIAYSLHTGREQLETRLAVVVETEQELAERLDAYAAGEESEDLVTGTLARGGGAGEQPDPEFIDSLIDKRRLRKLARLWCAGAAIDFRRLYDPANHRRVSPPHYPFAQERCWVEDPTPAVSGGERPPEPEQDAADPLERYFYAPEWTPWEPDDEAGEPPEGATLVVHAEGADALCAALLDGIPPRRAQRIVLGGETRLVEQGHWEVDADDPEALDACLAHVRDLGTVYFLGAVETAAADSSDPGALERAQRRGALSLLALVKALDRRDLLDNALDFKVLTSNVRATVPGARVQPFGATAAGVARAFAKEYPGVRTAIVDIDTRDGRVPGPSELELIRRPAARFELAVRPEGAFRRALKPHPLSEPDGTPLIDGGGYVVVGGTGNVGARFSRFAAERAGARIVWIGRRPQDGAIEELIAGVEALGGSVTYLSADVADRDALAGAMREAHKLLGHIDGVVHSAMDFEFGRLRDLDEDTYRAKVDAKVAGTHALAAVLRDVPADLLLLFSSGESFTGNAGLAAYGAGCDFQDAAGLRLAQDHSSMTTRVINWGFWEGNDRSGDPEVLRAKGIHPMQEDGMRALERVLAADLPQAMVLNVDDAVLEMMGVELDGRPQVAAPEPEPESAAPAPAEPVASAEELREPLLDYLATMIAEALQIDASKLDHDTDLAQYGVDSMLVISLQKELEERLGKLPVTLLIEHPSVRDLAGFLIVRHSDVVRTVLAADGRAPETAPPAADDDDAPVEHVLPEDSARLLRVVAREQIGDFLRDYGRRYQEESLADVESPPAEPRDGDLQHALVETEHGPKLEVVSAGDGVPMVFMPAVAQTAPVWLNQFETLPDGHRAIVVHPPGYGISDPAKEFTTAAVGELIADALERLELGRPVHLVASCFGGLAAQYIASEHPDRVASLTLCGGFFEDVGFLQALPEDMTTEQLFEITAEAGKALQTDFDRVVEEATDERAEHYQWCAQHLFGSQCSSPMTGLRYLTELWRLSTRDWLSQLEVPTLCIAGTEDTVVDPAISREIADMVPEARLVYVEGAGHYPFLTHADRFNRELLDHVTAAERQASLTSSRGS